MSSARRRSLVRPRHRPINEADGLVNKLSLALRRSMLECSGVMERLRAINGSTGCSSWPPANCFNNGELQRQPNTEGVAA